MEEGKNNLENQIGGQESLTGRSWINFVSSIVLVIVSFFIIFGSLKMPKPAGWGSAPGLIPLFLSVSTLFMSLGLLVSSIKNHGLSQLAQKCRGFSLSQYLSGTETKRSVLIILLTGFYLLILLDRVPFELAGFIYLASTFYVFWRKGGWRKIILISFIVPFSAGGIFRVIFQTIVPGDSIFDWFLTLIR